MKQSLFSEEFQEGTILKEGVENKSNSNIRTFLSRTGYMGAPPTAPMEALNLFDSDMTEAVRKYQSFHGLELTGEVDEETQKVMQMPRCGVADLIEGQEVHPQGVSSFVASGGKWSSNQVTYKFVNGTIDLPGTTEREIVRQAFQVWAEVIPLTFQEVTGSADATILISWVVGNHGDPSPFDGPGHVLAHAFFPPPLNDHPGIAGDTHFDEEENWATTHGNGKIDLLTVAIHELGHALGLRHSNVAGAIMFPTYNGIRRTLAADDIDGIQSIYGLPDRQTSWLMLLFRWIMRRFFGQ